MQSVARPGKVVIKFGEGKIAQVYHHCSGHLNHLQPAHMCKALAKGRKRLEHFDWNVYSCPWVLLVASFPHLEDLKAFRGKQVFIISSAAISNQLRKN